MSKVVSVSECADKLDLTRINPRNEFIKQCINTALKDPKELKALVDRIMYITNDKNKSKEFFKKTTKTAFRKLHQIYISTFDQLITLASKKKACDDNGKAFIIPLLVKAKVVTSYQSARGFVSNKVTNLLDIITNNLYTIYIDECKNDNNDEVAKAAEHARLILDSLVVAAENSLDRR